MEDVHMEDDHMDTQIDTHMDTHKPFEPLNLLLCSQLINTYNTTILGKMDLHMQEALLNEAQKKAEICATTNKQKDKERIVLKELIKSHYNPNLESRRQNLLPAYIGGPFNFTCHWSEYYQKLIYIFGETHSDETDCNNFKEKKSEKLIENFLKELIEITDCFLDVLVEFEGYKGYNYTRTLSELDDSNNRLVKIATTFSSCINASERDTEKNKPICSRSRIHYFDVRSIEQDHEQTGPDPVSHFISEYFHIIKQYPHIQDINSLQAYHFAYKLIQMTKKYEGIMNGFLLEINDNEDSPYFQFWHGMLLKNHYTTKEFKHLGDNYNIGEKIQTFIKSEMKLELQKKIKNDVYPCTPCCELINIIAKLIMDNSKFINRNPSRDLDLIENFESLIHLVASANASVIDAYLLARIFKKFDLNSQNEEKRRSTDEPDEARNIIIYAGNGHSAKYRKFLTQNGFELLADIGEAELEDEKKPSNCVNMKSKDQARDTVSHKKWTMQPLFSQWPPEKDPNLGVIVKDVKKNWGCNVMFRSKKPSIKFTENTEYIMNAFGVKRSPNDYYHEYEKSSNTKIVKVKRTSTSPKKELKKELNKGIKKTAGSI
jgi:hypothetical protein